MNMSFNRYNIEKGILTPSPRGGLGRGCAFILLLLTLLCACSQVIQRRSADETKKAAADSLLDRSYALYDSCRFEQAILAGQEALRAYQAIGDSASESDCYSHMTACHQRMGDVESGIEQTLKGLHIDSLRKDRARMSSDYNNLAALYLTADARRHLEKSADMARHMGNRYVLQQTLKTLSTIEPNDHQALLLLRESHDLSDSVYSEKTSQMMGSQAARFETLQKEQTIREQQYRLEKQTIWLLLGLLAATFLLILSIILAYVMRARSKAYQTSVNLLRSQYDESISQLLRKNMDEASGEAAEPTVTDDQEAHILLTRLNQIILSRLQDTAFNSEMLADEMYMSKRTLNRRVKEITNIDTASYIREFRIQAARRMLTETQLPVAEICMKCGFDSPSYFSRAFKAATDMSPSVYRKTFRGETSSKAIPE